MGRNKVYLEHVNLIVDNSDAKIKPLKRRVGRNILRTISLPPVMGGVLLTTASYA